MKRLIPRLLSTFLVIGSLAISLSGCAGYQLGAVKPSAYSGIQKIHIPPFKNNTLEPRLSSLVTNAVLKEIQADGTYQVSNRANADAILVGTVTDVSKRQLRAVRTNTLKSEELRMLLYLDFYLVDPVTNAKIRVKEDEEIPTASRRDDMNDDLVQAKQGRVVGRTIQFIDRNFQVGERNAQALAAEDAAQKLVSQLANGW